MSSRFVSGGVIAGDDGDMKKISGENASLLHPSRDVEGGDGQRRTSAATTATTATSVTSVSAAAAAAAGTGDSRSGGGSGGGSMSVSSQEWAAVQKDLDEERRRRAEARKRDVEGGGEKSLYEILQANKAAKQAAFEEQNRIKNQFRALDDDEIEFLHGVSDEKRAEEERLKRETEEGLASFRKAQLKVSTGSGGDDHTTADGGTGGIGIGADDDWGEDDEWAVSAATTGRKKRKRDGYERAGFKGLKRRTSSSVPEGEDKKKVDGTIAAATTTTDDMASSSSGGRSAAVTAAKDTPTATPSTTQPAASISPPLVSKPKPPLGLVDYGSDEDDE